METINLYGIKNCDTVKKARRWLEDNKINYTFHDFRTDGINRDQVKGWVNQLGWETLINKRSTSWKALDESIKNNLNDESAIDVVLETPTLIKRPLMINGKTISVGFKPQTYQTQLLAN
jgi:Spx/MgsR family transcriptional regulator